MDKPELHVILKKMILNQCRITCVKPEDCRLVSEAIFVKTRNYISESTIKRFFGHIDSEWQFSPFVLNSLAQFVGYSDTVQLLQEVNIENIQR